jgi:sulfatase modifying factor 1
MVNWLLPICTFACLLGCVGDVPSSPVARSCQDLPATCGPKQNASCCSSSGVPGGTFKRSYDGVTYNDSPTHSATVSAFRLDDYLITVGRFRAFLGAGQGTQVAPPSPGAGAHDRLTGSGWDPAWNDRLVASGGLPAALKCGGETWTDAPGANETKPINCVNWFEAFAFCAWDGGFLPTEAEWNYAAAGGDEQRVYPWSAPPVSTTIDDTYAVYCGGTCSLQTVGSRSPKGDGRWGQADLAGSVWEWNLDWWQEYGEPCVDCASVSGGTYRIVRGGGFRSLPGDLLVAERVQGTPSERDSFYGARCARSSH